MPMPGRKSGSQPYRFSFQGQEKDDEIKGQGNSLNYEYRMHDPRIGRFFAIDPLASEYPHNSPYAFSENRVLDGVELEGLEFENVHDVEPSINNVTKPSENPYGVQVKTPSGGFITVGDNFYIHGSYILGGDEIYEWNDDMWVYLPLDDCLPEDFCYMEDKLVFPEGGQYVISTENVQPYNVRPTLRYYDDEILYNKEFKQGIGPKNRVFLEDHSMTQQLLTSPLIQNTIDRFYNEEKNLDNGWYTTTFDDGSIQFLTSTPIFNGSDHLSHSGAVLFTGSAEMYFYKVPNSSDVFVLVSNVTSMNSYVYHFDKIFGDMNTTNNGLPSSWIRPNESNIYQNYIFKIPESK